MNVALGFCNSSVVGLGFVLLDCMVLGFLIYKKEKCEAKQVRLIFLDIATSNIDINMESDEEIAKPLST